MPENHKPLPGLKPRDHHQLSRARYKTKRWRLPIIFIITVLGVVLIYLLWRRSNPTSAELLTQAYSQQRTLELRIKGASYAPPQPRKQISSSFDRPRALLEAEARIGRQLQQQPEASIPLAQRGQANLLEWSYEAAITDFQQALDAEPKSPEILTDLASAYFERAESEQRFSDFGMAFELQSRALQFDSSNIVALFNRAITGEHLYLFKQCNEDWSRYLYFDTASDWSREAKEHQDRIQHILQSHDQHAEENLLSPSEFARIVKSADPQTWARVEPRIEDYLSAAITNWLPSAFPVKKIKTSPDTLQSLGVLATILKVAHRDLWLSDLLSDVSTKNFAEGIFSLSRSITANGAADDYSSGLKEAVRAAKLFSSSSGKIRAQLEEIYALHLSDAASECIVKASLLRRHLQGLEYPWIESQLKLEQSACASKESDLDIASGLERAAYGSARTAHYPTLALRALGFMADTANSTGKIRLAWQLCDSGLQEYWANSLDSMPAYNLYTFVERLAQNERHWQLEMFVEQQALTFLNDSSDPILGAVEHSRLGRTAILAQAPEIAHNELTIAGRLLDSAPQSEVTRNYRMDLQIDLARAEHDSEQSKAALERLSRLHSQIDKVSNDVLLANYYQTFGEIQASDGNLQASRQSFERAVDIIEHQRSSLRSDTDRLTWTEESDRYYRDLVQNHLRTHNYVDALVVWNLYRGAALRPPLHNDRTQNPKSEASLLKSAIAKGRSFLYHSLPFIHHQTVLVYVMVPHGLSIWAYSDSGITSYWVNKDPAYIRMLARHFGELCTDPSSSLSAIRVMGAQLYKLLISPVIQRIGPDEGIVIETDDDLGTVPFQALVGEDGNYFSDQHPISYSLGLHYFDQLQRDDPKFTRTAQTLVVSSARGSRRDGIHTLFDVTAESQNLKQIFPNARILTGNETSLTNIKRELPQVTVFHYAGHAGIIGGRIGLLLDSEGRDPKTEVFDAQTITKIPLPHLRLAMLIACSTEKSSDGIAFSSESLVQSLLRAGVPHVVASRWNVDSASSQALARTFYDALLSGKSASQALAIAEHDLRMTEQHPYYWAGFDAFGRT